MSQSFRTGAHTGTLVACALLAFNTDHARAQSPSFAAGQRVYTQNFNSFADNGYAISNSPVQGLTVTNTGSPLTQIVPGDGGSGTGALYNYGTIPADRALGSVSTSGTGSIFFGLRLQNNTGATISEFNVFYTGEQWRRVTSVAQKLDFSYIVSADFSTTGSVSGVYTDVNTLDFTSLKSGSATALDGNSATNRTSLGTTNITTGANGWRPGEYLYLRWTDTNESGDNHGLAVDDVTVAIPEPGSLALTLLGVVPLGVVMARRRKSMHK